MPRQSNAISELSRFRDFVHANLAWIWSATLCLTLAASLQAQERVRSSQVQLPIQAYVRSPQAFFYMGPLQEILTGSAGVQYTDNVQLSNTNKISDLSYFQSLSLDTTYVVSHLNQLRFNFGGSVTEHFYGNGRSQVNLAVDPNSQIEFKFSIGDVQVRLFDQFSYTQNPTADPTRTNTANLNELNNTIGAVVDTDLNLAILSFLADLSYDNQSPTNAEGQNTVTNGSIRQTLRAGPSLVFQLTPTITYGPEIIATRTTGLHASSVNSLNMGPFIKGKLSKEFEFDLSAGGTLIDAKPSIPNNYYFSVVFRYLINPHWQLLFSGSHDLIFTSGTDLTEQNLFRIGTGLDLTRAISFNASPFVNFGTIQTSAVGSGVTTGPYTQFGLELGLTWKLRKRWSTDLVYDYIRRESDAALQGTGTTSYIQNTIALSLHYEF